MSRFLAISKYRSAGLVKESPTQPTATINNTTMLFFMLKDYFSRYENDRIEVFACKVSEKINAYLTKTHLNITRMGWYPKSYFFQAFLRKRSQLPCITFSTSRSEYPRFFNNPGIF